MEKHRTERLAEALREELEEILNYEMEDPRIDALGVSEVLLSSDGRRATVLLSPLKGNPNFEDSLAAADHAKHHIRYILMERMELYRMPEIRFEAAAGSPVPYKARHLMRRVRKGRPRDQERDEKA